MNIVELASQYFTLKHKNANNYQLVTRTGQFDSIVLFGDTNSWHRFSNGQGGNPKRFLTDIIGLSEEEAVEIAGEDSAYNLNYSTERYEYHTGLSFMDVVAKPGYNDYIASRGVSRETAEYFGLETNFSGDVYIPLLNIEGLRVGSLVRRADTNDKGLKYRFLMIDGHKRPDVFCPTVFKQRRRDTQVVLFEGCWANMLLTQWIQPTMPNVIPLSTIGTNLTDATMDYIYEFPITVVLDTDDKGSDRVVNTVQKWRNKGINIKSVNMESKDGQLLYPDEVTERQFKNFFRQALKEESKYSLLYNGLTY